MTGLNCYEKKLELYDLFLWMGFTVLNATVSLRDSLLFTTQFPRFRGIHLTDMGGWKDESISEPPIGFEPGTPGFGIQRLKH